MLLSSAGPCVVTLLSHRSADRRSVTDCPQIACYKICTVRVNRAVRDRTKQVTADAARMQEDRSPPKCANLT